MRKVVGLSFIILAFVCSGLAQAQSQTDQEKEAELAKRDAFNSRVDNLRNVGKERYVRDRYKETRVYQDYIVPLYRDLEKAEIELLAPDPADIAKYPRYVEKEDRGVTKLIADKGCDKGQALVVAEEHCAAYGMPGAGSSYSFRSRLYRVKRLADITFTGSEFNTLGIWKHGILISLGDVALEDLTADSSILETLAGFTPPEDIVKASQFAGYLEKGIAGGEIVYKDSHPAIVDTTYVVRSIAYRGEHWESLKEVVYDELEFDKRRDVIVAFRVIRLVPNESATIVWKVLSDKKSPRIEGG